MGTSMRPRVINMESEANVSMLSKSDGEQASDVQVLPGNKASRPAIPSMLDPLRALRKLELVWKLAVRKNPSTADSHRRKQPCCSTNLKSVTPSSRVHEFPKEKLTTSTGKLFCAAFANHIASFKHKHSKVKLSKKGSREKDIAKALVACDEPEHPRGKSLPRDLHVYCVKVVSVFS